MASPWTCENSTSPATKRQSSPHSRSRLLIYDLSVVRKTAGYTIASCKSSKSRQGSCCFNGVLQNMSISPRYPRTWSRMSTTSKRGISFI